MTKCADNRTSSLETLMQRPETLYRQARPLPSDSNCSYLVKIHEGDIYIPLSFYDLAIFSDVDQHKEVELAA
jgi:hypothetical protein